MKSKSSLLTIAIILLMFISYNSLAQKKSWEDYGLKLFSEKKDNLTLMGLKKADGQVVLAPKYVVIKEDVEGGYAITAQPKGEKLTNEEIVRQGKSKTLEILCGLIDSTGKVVIEPFATTIQLPFKGNITTVSLSDKGLTNTRSNLLTKQGKLLSEEYSPLYYNLDNSFFVVYSKNGLKSGLVNLEGMYILPFEYDEILYKKTEHGDFARVGKAKKYGLYSIKDKKMIVPIAYDFLIIPEVYFPLVEVANAGKNGIYDISKNKLILPCTFTGEITPEYITTADNKEKLGYFTVKNTDAKTYSSTYGMIEINGKMLLENIYAEILPLQQTEEYTIGYMKIINKKLELIDGLNKEVLIGYFVINHKNNTFEKSPMKFGYFTMGKTPFSALVTDYKAGGMGLINCLTHKYIVEPMLGYSSGLFRTNYFICQKYGKPGILDFSGKEIIPFGQYDEIVESSYRDTIMVLNVRKDGKWGCIEPSGKIILLLQYDKQVLFDDKMWVSKNGYWGCIDNNQKQLIEFKFDTVTYRDFEFTDKGITCYESNALIKLDKNGNIQIPCKSLKEAVEKNDKYSYTHLVKNAKAEDKAIALYYAIYNCNIEMFRVIMANQPELSYVYDHKPPIYHVALKVGGMGYSDNKDEKYIEMLTTLVKSGADPNQKGWFGETPLIQLVDGYTYSSKFLKLFIDAGCKVSIEDEKGKNALDYAKKRKLPEKDILFLKEQLKNEK